MRISYLSLTFTHSGVDKGRENKAKGAITPPLGVYFFNCFEKFRFKYGNYCLTNFNYLTNMFLVIRYIIELEYLR